MKVDMLREMLLLPEPNAIKLYREIMNLALMFLTPAFMIALIVEYFGAMDFGGVVKKLLIITVSISFFYEIHTSAVNLAFDGASSIIQKVNPDNLFIKKWTGPKMVTAKLPEGNTFGFWVLTQVNDVVATTFFLVAKLFIWFLKLIFSTVYHLTYIFFPVCAILYFFGWTNGSLKGAVQASLWCVIMPFVVMVILVLVGNSMSDNAKSGEFIAVNMDTIIWLFGVTLMLLLTPAMALGIVSGKGVHALGSKMGVMLVGAGVKAGAVAAIGGRVFSSKTNLGKERRSSLKSGHYKNNASRDSNSRENLRSSQSATENTRTSSNTESSKGESLTSHSKSNETDRSLSQRKEQDLSQRSQRDQSSTSRTAENSQLKSNSSSSALVPREQGRSEGILKDIPTEGMNRRSRGYVRDPDPIKNSDQQKFKRTEVFSITQPTYKKVGQVRRKMERPHELR